MSALENQGNQKELVKRFDDACSRIDTANSQDPNFEQCNGKHIPRELAYSRWLSDWVLRLKPEASEALRLAARAQHICRWQMPRSSHPQTREGYLKWRAELKQFHAAKAVEILLDTGYEEETVTRVRDLILKKLFPRDEEARVLEDALCLVFLERQLAGLAAKTSDEKMINALRKSWAKMTHQAQELALDLPYGPREKLLLQRALS